MDTKLNDGFKSLFGDKPFDFQSRVAEHLLDGRSVVLRAPTGAGKTLTALFPFLYARIEGLSFPRQMIYSLPLRTLATALYEGTKEAIEKAFPDEANRPNVTIQTGEMPQDRQFTEGDVVFATYDQSLSSLLTIPVGLSRREGNINAGAMIGSYLVFDEFHLMEMARSFSTMVLFLEWLRGWSPFLLMTATLSETLVQRLAHILGAESVSVTEADLQLIPSQKNKERTFQVQHQPLSVQDIVAHHDQRTIVVCNTVDHAQSLFIELRNTLKGEGADETVKARYADTELVLLHSRFLPEDRKTHETNIRQWFGKDFGGRKNAILIATQVIEVGLDITCETLHSEIAPADSIVQRAGRCARFPGDRGNVNIYDVEENDEGSKMYLPYDDALSIATWNELQKSHMDNCVVGYLQEQELVDAVFGKVDEDALTKASINKRRSEIAGASGVLTTQERAEYRNLVRYVDSRSFFVHARPEDVDSPLRMQTFSASPGTLARWHKQFGGSQFSGSWFAQVVEFVRPNTSDRTEGYERPQYQYHVVLEPGKFYKEFFFVIHPDYVDYSSEVGLRFEQGGNPPEQLMKPVNKDDFITSYELETYQEHIERVMAAYEREFVGKGRIEYAAQRLQEKHGVSLDHLIRVAIAAHDIGKLNDRWQMWVQAWQKECKNRPVDPKQFYAHTDYDGSKSDKSKQGKLNGKIGSRPPHATESAWAIYDVLLELLDEPLAQVIFTAVTRHHSPDAGTVHPFRLSAPAQAEAKRVFSLISQTVWKDEWTSLLSEGSSKKTEEPVSGLLSSPESMSSDHFLIYLIVVRALRISDQRSFVRENVEEVTP